MIPLCLDQGVGVIPWSPLARGFLTGRAPDGPAAHDAARDRRVRPTSTTPRRATCDVIDALGRGGAARGHATAQVALAWLLQQPGVTAPIVGATKLEHLDDARRRADLSAVTRRDRAPRGALRAAPGAGPRVAGRTWRAPPPARPRPGTRSSATSTCAPTPTTSATPTAGRRRSRAARLAGCPRAATCSTSRAASGAMPCRWPARATAWSASTAPRRCSRRPGGGPGTSAGPSSSTPTTASCRSPDESFDAAVNLFTSLGYLGDDGGRAGAGRDPPRPAPDGRLVIEMMHRDRSCARFDEQDWRLVGEGRLLLERRGFDPAAGVAQTTQTLIAGSGRA